MPNRNKEEGGHSVLQREGPVGIHSCRERDMICGNNSCVYEVGDCGILQFVAAEATESDVISTQVSGNQRVQCCDNKVIEVKTVHLFDKLMSSGSGLPLVYGST